MSNIFTTVFLKFISEIVFIFIALRTQSNKERNGVIMRANLEKRGKSIMSLKQNVKLKV